MTEDILFEDAIHYILECCLYNEAREELKLRLVFLNELKIEVLLFEYSTSGNVKFGGFYCMIFICLFESI
jgi:hypothetical protein